MPRSPRRLRFAGAFLAIGLAVLPSEGLVLAVSDDATALPWCGSLSSEPVGPGPSASSWTSGHGDVYPGAWGGMASAPIAPRTEHSVVWTGDQAIYWGGDGAAYVPSDDTWREIAPSCPCAAGARHTRSGPVPHDRLGGGTGGRVLTDRCRVRPGDRHLGRPRGPGMGGSTGTRALDGFADARLTPAPMPRTSPWPGALAYDPVADTWERHPADRSGTSTHALRHLTGTRTAPARLRRWSRAGTEVARKADFDPVSRRWGRWSACRSRATTTTTSPPVGATAGDESQPPALHEGRPTSVILDARSSSLDDPQVRPSAERRHPDAGVVRLAVAGARPGGRGLRPHRRPVVVATARAPRRCLPRCRPGSLGR